MIIRITINGNEYEVSDGETILNVCRKLEIFVPHLCYLKEFSPSGVCGLCAVEFDDGKIALSCLTHTKNGMTITTDSKRLSEVRKINIDMMLKNHNINCFNCLQNGTCDLQNFSAQIYKKCGIYSDLEAKKIDSCISEISDKFVHDRGKCVNCLKCVKFLNKVCNKDIKKIEAFESPENSNDMILNAADICPTDAIDYERNAVPTFLCEECETYDINDVFTPKFLIYKADNEIIKIKSITGNYINDKTRISLKNIPERIHDEDDYKRIIDSLTENIKSKSHGKNIFVIGDNLDIVSLYYIKTLSEKFENVRICINDSQIPMNINIPIGMSKSDLTSIDFAIFLGYKSTVDKYHVTAFSSRIKNSVSLALDEIDQFSDENDDPKIFSYNNPYLFLNASTFNEFDTNVVLEKIKKFENQYLNKYAKTLKVRIFPENLSQMTMQDIKNRISMGNLFTKFNKHDLQFICVVGDVNYDLKTEGIFTVYNSVFRRDGNEYIPSKHFTEDSAYYVNVFRETIKTNKIIKNNLKSNKEFLLDLMKNVLEDAFEDINSDIHKSIRRRFFQ